MNRTLALFPIIALMSACTGETPGAHPTDMSVEAHEKMAAANDATASGHDAKFDPKAETEKQHCNPQRGGKDAKVCWSSVENPTVEHTKEADSFRKMANDHRAAAQALRDAEASACSGISDDDRDISPFAHREDITAADALVVRSTGKSAGDVTKGGSITIRAVPGLTKEYLERVLSCHVARNAAIGFGSTEMAFCPLDVKGATAVVTSVDGGFRVDVSDNDETAAKEIAKRAKALVSTK